MRVSLFVQLPLIECINENLDSFSQRPLTPGKTARLSCQTRQIMSQFGIVTFDRVGFTFVWHWMVDGWPIQNGLIACKKITVIGAALYGLIENILHDRSITLKANSPSQNAPCSTIYEENYVDSVFLEPIKVKSSSISTSSTSSGTGASGNSSA